MMRVRPVFLVKVAVIFVILCLGSLHFVMKIDTWDTDRQSDRVAAAAERKNSRHGQRLSQNNVVQVKEQKNPVIIGLPKVEGVEIDLKKKREVESRNKQLENHVGESKQFTFQNNSRFGHKPKRKADPAVLKSTLGNFEDPDDQPRSGPGEYGVAMKLDPAAKPRYDSSIKEYGFNMIISDQISLDRAVPDIRDNECKYWHYPVDLPTASVVIVFHNEGWSTLIRTIHSVFNTSPQHILHEIVMVDDYSDKSHLKEQFADYINDPKFKGKIKLIRNTKREGLIGARTIGAVNSHGDVVVFLDAHCECNRNWLPPLLTRIAMDRTTVVCPTVDSIDADTFSYGPQPDGMCRGAFDWEFWYKRIPIGEREKKHRTHNSEPYPSPVMAGGLFAIDRSFFFELGAYDPGLKIWGGEQYEISFKIWMCGGRLEFVPCSRVAHIYRKLVPYTYPDSGGDVSVVHQNHMRVVEVWLDDYKKYFYANQPELLGKKFGNISAQVEFRKKNCPHNFKWFLEEVAYDLLPNYPLPAANKYWGQVNAYNTPMCLDTMGRKNGGRIGVTGCHGMGGNQLFRINEDGEFKIYDQCLTALGTSVYVDKCYGKKSGWDYDQLTRHITINDKTTCMMFDGTRQDIVMATCDSTMKTQMWDISTVN